MTISWFFSYFIELGKLLLVLIGLLEFPYQKKNLFWILGGCIFVYTMLLCASFFQWDRSINTYIFGMLIMLIGVLVIQGKQKIYCTVLSFAVISFLDVIFGVFLVIGNGKTMEIWMQADKPSIGLALISMPLLFVGWFIKQKHKKGMIQSVIQQIPKWMYIAGIAAVYTLSFIIVGVQYIFLIQFEGKQKVVLFSSICFIGILILLVLYGFVAIYYHKKKTEILLKENIKLAEQKDQYDVWKQEKEKEIRKMLHDVKHHVQMLHLLNEQKDYEALEDYLTELQPRVYDLNMGLDTGHKMTNVIINNWAQKCLEKHIMFKWSGGMPLNLTVSNLDIGMVFSNLLSNAYEACMRITDENQRWITVETKTIDSHMMLTISNATIGKVQIKDGVLQTSKSDREKHGFGHLNIQEIVEKNNGKLEYQIKENIFSVEISFLYCVREV